MDARHGRGFTLPELVMVIVILGIIAGVLAPVITQAFRGYVDTRARAQLVNKGRIALERLAREVRHAVPNSLRVLGGGSGIEFVRATTGGRYIARHGDDIGAAFPANNNRYFLRNAALANGLFVLGVNGAVTAGDILVIGNTSPNELTLGSTAAAITAVAGQDLDGDGTNDSQLIGFAVHSFPHDSLGRHYIVADDTLEVGLSGTTLRWHQTVGLGAYDSVAQWGVGDPILVDGVSALTFTYAAGMPQSTGVLRIDLELQDTRSTDHTIRLYHEVHVRNTP